MSAPNISDYLNLITSEHRKPKFQAMVQVYAQWAVDRRNLLASFQTKFDLDTAVGVQLDVLGLWANISRSVVVIPSEAFPAPNPYVVVLDDTTYRRAIKACVMANHWDGTPAMLATILSTFYQPRGISAGVRDNQDMSIDVYLSGGNPTDAEAALLSQMIIPVRPAGVRINNSFISPTGPLFGLDVENALISGVDVGSFGKVF